MAIKEDENKIIDGDKFILRYNNIKYILIIQLGKDDLLYFYLKQDDDEINTYFMKGYNSNDVRIYFDLSPNKENLRKNYDFFVDLFDKEKITLEKDDIKKGMKILFKKEGLGSSYLTINLDKYTDEGKILFRKLLKEINNIKNKDYKAEIKKLKENYDSKNKNLEDKVNSLMNEIEQYKKGKLPQKKNGVEFQLESKEENSIEKIDIDLVHQENKESTKFKEEPGKLKSEGKIYLRNINSSENELNNFDVFLGIKDHIYYLLCDNIENQAIEVHNIQENILIKSLKGHYKRTSVIRYFLNLMKEEYILSCDINSKAIIWDVANDYSIKYILRMEDKAIIRDAILLFNINQKNYIVISRYSKEEYTKLYKLEQDTPFVKTIFNTKKKLTNKIIPWEYNNKYYIIELCNGIISIKNIFEEESYTELKFEKTDNFLSGFLYQDKTLVANIVDKKQILILDLIEKTEYKLIDLTSTGYSLINWNEKYAIIGGKNIEIIDLGNKEIIKCSEMTDILYSIKKIKNNFFGEGLIAFDEKNNFNLFCVYGK